MDTQIKISVVIPTCNREASLLRLLKSLERSTYPVLEVIVVDSSDNVLPAHTFADFSLKITYLRTERSVCIQRNRGIEAATGEWIFLCDDDLELPPDYLQTLTDHVRAHPEAGCVTGSVLQNNGKGNSWTHQYPVTSSIDLIMRFVFQLSVWGEIQITKRNFVIRRIERYYHRHGNHLSKAGWPVVTNFSGSFFRAPFYGLGASLVRKEWLVNSPYDEVLDPHGIGDNYGVASGFPQEGIHVVNTTFVYHYRAMENRLRQAQLYYRRMLALDYFLRTKRELKSISRAWFIWSVVGSTLILLRPRELHMVKVNLKLLVTILAGDNPYIQNKNRGRKVTIPEV